MVQAAEYRKRDDWPAVGQGLGRTWNGLPDPLVGPSVVEVAGVFLERAANMVLTQDQDVIEALSTQAAQEALADGIRLGCSVGCAQYLDACGDPCEGRAVLGVVVADEVSWSLAKRCCDTQSKLPHHPNDLRDW